MAIVKVKKVRLVAHQSWQEPLIAALHEWGLMQLTNVREQLAKSEFAEELASYEGNFDAASAEESQARIKLALDYLKRYDTQGEGLIESFLALKAGVSREQMDEIVQNYDGLELATRFSRYDKRLAEIATELKRLQAERRQLDEWAALDIAPSRLKALNGVEVVLGTVPTSNYEAFISKLVDASGQMTAFELISKSIKDCKLALIHLVSDQVASQFIRESIFSRVNLPRPELLPRAAVTEIDIEIQALTGENDEIVRDSRVVLEEKVKLQALYDYYGQQAQRQQAPHLMANTSQVFFVEGWVEARRLADFERLMQEHFSEVVIFVSDPVEGDNPPVVLQNSGLNTPFEFVMNTYGWPLYSEIDPTAVLAPFFALFFAIALGDAGYGLVLMGVSIWFMRKYDLDKYGKKFFRLFLMCGVVTVFVGFALNGFFGNLIDLTPWAGLRALKSSLVLLDPMKNPLGMMILTVMLGVVHVFTGFAVKAYGAWKNGDKASALLDSGPWMFWIASLLFLAVAGTMPALKALAPIAKYTAMAGAASIVLTQGRGAKSIVGKLGGGLYALYNTVGPFSDTLSYTRLLALGLSTSVIGMVVNTFAVMLADIPFVGWLLMIVLLIFGHLFNILLALLGCFIHSARLQYVEFFTKFFEGGGAPFNPFRRESKYTVIKG